MPTNIQGKPTLRTVCSALCVRCSAEIFALPSPAALPSPGTSDLPPLPATAESTFPPRDAGEGNTEVPEGGGDTDVADAATEAGTGLLGLAAVFDSEGVVEFEGVFPEADAAVRGGEIRRCCCGTFAIRDIIGEGKRGDEHARPEIDEAVNNSASTFNRPKQ